MLVSSPPSPSKSRSLRLVPVCCRVGDLDCEVAVEAMLFVGEMIPDCVRVLDVCALDCALVLNGLASGGRIDCFRGCKLTGGLGSPAMAA